MNGKPAPARTKTFTELSNLHATLPSYLHRYGRSEGAISQTVRIQGDGVQLSVPCSCLVDRSSGHRRTRQPGDILVGHDEGVIVADNAAFSAIVDAAEAIQTRKKSIRAAIEAGTSLFDLMTFSTGQYNMHTYLTPGAGPDSTL
jgi:hypothetical protein